MAEATDRYGLPLLQAGQSQKEVTHNEAIVRADALLHPAVESRTLASPPTSPAPGQAWIVATGASGEWAGRDGSIAAFQAGGWTFVVPSEGCLVWVKNEGVFAVFAPGGWNAEAWPVKGLSLDGDGLLTNPQPAIAAPTGGATVDNEARAVIGQILSALRAHGLIQV